MDSYKIVSRTKDNGSIKSLLKNGMVPGILYGKDAESIKITFEEKTLKKIMGAGSFYSKILDLKFDGTTFSSRTIKPAA